MEYESIEREIFIAASPEVVFDVVSRPEHMTEWWSDEADFPLDGAPGQIVFHGTEPGADKVVPVVTIDLIRPQRFSFRWDFPPGLEPTADNSLLVTFELEASGNGTLLRMSEIGFRERGWEAAVLEANYREHAAGWDFFIPRIGEYVDRLVSTS